MHVVLKEARGLSIFPAWWVSKRLILSALEQSMDRIQQILADHAALLVSISRWFPCVDYLVSQRLTTNHIYAE